MFGVNHVRAITFATAVAWMLIANADQPTGGAASESAGGGAPVGAPKVGDVAPDFTLPATDGKTYHLADYRGKETVVLAWFPKAYTKGCTLECKSLAENGHLLKRYQVAYFMASVDALDDNKGFAAEQKADFPLLSDPTKAIAKAYGVLHPAGFAKRYTFYIGVDGRILAIDDAVVPETSAQDIARRLGELGVAARS